MFGRCHRRLQDRAGESADRSRDMLKLARAMPAELGKHALVGGVKRNKESNVNQSGDTRLGLGQQLLRARIRPMAGDSPSGERLAGQSGLVFDVGAR